MAVYDRWHKDPRPGEQPCKCSRGRNRLYPSSVHERGGRWQVRWRDPATGKQKKRDFALKEGKDPELHAEAYDAVIAGSIVSRNYVDPAAGNVTLRAYAETWRRSRKHDDATASRLESRLRCHVYEGEPGSGLTSQGGVSIGQHPMGLLAQRPSLVQGWLAAMPLAEAAAVLVSGDVSSIFAAAVDDQVVPRNPLRLSSVQRPKPGRTKAHAWPAETVAAMEAALPPRLKVVPRLGASTGMRQGEMLGLGVDDVTFLGRDPRVSVTRQVKVVGGKLCFAPVKNRVPHSVPLAPSLALALARHLEQFPAREVTLPWHDLRDREMHGEPVTVRLVLVNYAGRAWRYTRFNVYWWEAQEAAGVTELLASGKRKPARQDGCHVLRHTFASAQLRGGVDLVRVASWMGDTVEMVAKTYAHMMPGNGDADGRAAVDAFFAPSAPGVPQEGSSGTSAQADG